MGTQATASRDGVRAFAESAGSGASGILYATRGKHRRLICLDAGNVIYAVSNLIEEQFDEELIRMDLLGLGQRAAAKAIAAQEGRPFTSVVLEKGHVDLSALTQARVKHVRGLVLSSLEWTDAEFRFDQGQPKLDGELLVRVPGLLLVLEHVRRHPTTLDEVRVRIGPPKMRPVTTDRAARLVDGVELEKPARAMIEGCDGTRELSVLLSQANHSNEELLRPLYGFMLMGLVEAAKEDTAAQARKAWAQVGRDEILARLRQAEGVDHYLVLGVDSKASASDIRDAYYMLARRFHPDRFSTGPLADLRPKIESYFTQVTEAHNTLADPEKRQQYDEELAVSVVQKTKEPDRDTAFLARENFARGRLLLDKGRYQDAVQFLENAIQLDDTKAEYHLELGRVLVRNPRRRADAERMLLRATDLNPTSVPGFIALGQLYAKMGREKEAGAALREALRWEPENIEAKRELADLG